MPKKIKFSSRLKKGQMAKSFYFLKTVSKRPNKADLAFLKSKKAKYA
jgi:hypothetical protein